MKRQLFFSSLWIGTSLFAQAYAGSLTLKGSDTLAPYMDDAIRASGLETSVAYQGGGSSLGESALINKEQHLAPMSRAFKPEQLQKAAAAGIQIVEHVIGLDGVGVFVNKGNSTASLTLDQLKKIYSCEINNWSAVGGQDEAITVYRRDDASGTTDTFKSLLGLASFGSCVQVLNDTAAIADVTAKETTAVGYSGLSAIRDSNRELPLAKSAGAQAFAPNPANIRSFDYPLARRLYVYEAVGTLTEGEQTLLSNILDRSFSDPILTKHDFFTLD
jgi:phosphate transport system substrate-binding protein